jgi:uncharacterized protein YutE (UPF0331/DUF86 family)
MLEKDALLSKISIIKNCQHSIERATRGDPETLDDFLVQDVFVLNVQRSVQACIDIAHIIIAKNGWKLPASYKESFQILLTQKVISHELATIMMKMCGFRNISVHEYQEITPPILKTILIHHLRDFEQFYSAIIDYMREES